MIGSYAAQDRLSRELTRSTQKTQRAARTRITTTAATSLSIQLRGEYLYTANGEDGFEVYDVANVDNKDFSERIVTAPVSPLGQRTYVKTKFARCGRVCRPRCRVDPTRKTRNPENRSSRSTRSTPTSTSPTARRA